GIRQDQLAAEVARRALRELGREGPTRSANGSPGAAGEMRISGLDAGHFPVCYDHFRVEWERAAWDHPGDLAGEAHVKRDLLRWRLHGLLAGLTDDLVHYYEAAAARPDLPTARAALGCALARAKHVDEAVAHLRFAAEANPFDRDAARAL